jgi:anti-sigma factor RsiW
MGSAVSHDQLRELLGAFALDAVDPGEAAFVRAHVGGCPRCRDEVAEYQRTAAMLANTGGAAPAGVWQAIAARIEETPPASDVLPILPTRELGRRGTSRRLRPRVAGGLVALTAAVVAAVAFLGVRVDHLDHRLNQMSTASAGQSLSVAAQAALLDPAAQRIALTGTAPGAARVAEVVVLPSGAAFWFNQGLPTVAASQTYQLWAMVDGQAISVAVLGDDPQTVAFSLDGRAITDAFAVTVEPAGGSVAPTRPPVASTTI